VNLFDTTQLALEGAMHGASRRHEVLAANISNVNTPGYQRRDVDFHSALSSALEAAQDSGSARDRLASVSTIAEQVDAGITQRVDGNGVDIDTESAELAKNGLEYDAMVQVAKGRMDILRSAMGVG
jgi:flagellar basal-body rod protein FlgB